jgi:hypothetical protein
MGFLRHRGVPQDANTRPKDDPCRFGSGWSRCSSPLAASYSICLRLVGIFHNDAKLAYLWLLGIAVRVKEMYEFIRHMAARPYTFGVHEREHPHRHLK